MRTDVIVLSEPLVDDNLGLLRRREPLGVEYLVALEQWATGRGARSMEQSLRPSDDD